MLNLKEKITQMNLFAKQRQAHRLGNELTTGGRGKEWKEG